MTFIDIAAIGTISSYLTLSVVESVRRVYREDKEPTFIGLVFSTIYETVKFGIEFVHDLFLDINKKRIEKKLNAKKPSVTEEYYVDVDDMDMWDLEESYESEAEDYELII